MEKEIIWSVSSEIQLKEIYFYLLEKSKSKIISDNVIDTIINSVSILKTNWEIYELDEMKNPNDGNYRAFEIYNYRISYKITTETINILRIRHIEKS